MVVVVVEVEMGRKKGRRRGKSGGLVAEYGGGN